jgi:hypothetical protein
MSDNSSNSYVNNVAIIQENCKPNMPLQSGLCKINIAGYSLDNFKTFDPTGYTVLCQLGETCDALNYFPVTSKIVLNVGEQSQLGYNLQNLLPNIAKDLAIPEEAALQTAADFFSDKKVVVQPVGIQGKVYNIMRSAQNYIPMIYTRQAVGTIKTTGLTGVQVLSQAPLTFVGATYIGALFFGYCGGIAGNNSVGFILNSTSYALSRPMRGVEIVLNGLALRPLSNLVGVPLMLNGTQEMISGIGISVQDYSKVAFAFERLTNSTVVQKIKKIYKVLLTKD